MIKFPLKKPIILLTTNGNYVCRVIHSNLKEKIITVVDTQQLVPNGFGGYNIINNDVLCGKVYFEREQIVGYKNLTDLAEFKEENEKQAEVLDKYNKSLVQTNRTQLRVINGGSNKKTTDEIT